MRSWFFKQGRTGQALHKTEYLHQMIEWVQENKETGVIVIVDETAKGKMAEPEVIWVKKGKRQ